jgi:hypothetical protein
MYQIATGAFEATGIGQQKSAERSDLSDSDPSVGLADRNRRLLVEIQQLKAEQKILRDRESKIMELLGTKSPDQILHDLRNVLNEKELFKVLAFRDER